jgi:hypothetical protein
VPFPHPEWTTGAIVQLPPDTYYLCAFGTKPTHLRTCQWSKPELKVDIGPGQTVQGIKFQIADGTLLIFNIHDPREITRDLADLPVVDGHIPLTGSNFGIGVFSGIEFARASMISNSSGVRQYRLAVPKDASLRLFLDTELPMIDARGNALAVGRPDLPIPVRGEPTITIELQVP